MRLGRSKTRRLKEPTAPGRRPRVVLLIESSRAYGRRLLLGVSKFVRDHGPWTVVLEEYTLCDRMPEWLDHWEGEGILMRLENPLIVEAVRRLAVPTVFLRNAPKDLAVPSVLTDNGAVARDAFAHLKDLGLRHFAFCGYEGADYSDERRAAFVDAVARIGLTCHVFKGSGGSPSRDTAGFERDGLKDHELLGEWLGTLPKPIGLMACNDIRGQQVLDVCRTLGTGVPDEVAVVGVDNDEVLCDFSDPPMSSVVPDAERVGFEAAVLLDKMMAGHQPPIHPLYIPSKGVVARHSTDVLAIDDPPIAAAVRFIREHASDDINVGDIVRAVALSRSTFETRFAKALGRSPKQEILRVRLKRAMQLLSETDSSLEFVAEKLGFDEAGYFSRIFKKKIGLTPMQFRAQSRLKESVAGAGAPPEAAGSARRTVRKKS